MINQGVRAHEGVTIAWDHDGNHFVATVMICRNNNLAQLFRGRVTLADGFRKAKEESISQGFRGYYEITEPNEWPAVTAAEYGTAIAEITQQLAAAMPGAASWGGMPQGSPADVVSAQQHVARLDRLQGRFTDLALRLASRR